MEDVLIMNTKYVNCIIFCIWSMWWLEKSMENNIRKLNTVREQYSWTVINLVIHKGKSLLPLNIIILVTQSMCLLVCVTAALESAQSNIWQYMYAALQMLNL